MSGDISLFQHIEKVKQKLATTNKLAAEYNKNVSRISSLAKGYVQNTNILIELSSVLQEYKLLMSKVVEQLETFDKYIKTQNENTADYMGDLTSDNLENITHFFESDKFKQVKEDLDAFGKGNVSKMLDKSKEHFSEIVVKGGKRRVARKKK